MPTPIFIQPGELYVTESPPPASQYLSEDETGGGGAAIGPLESTPPGISPSIHLRGK